ncbi:MAG: hypothetical protein ISR57_03665 [Bacteroidales bacterium]|nr:hypothetical protein [Bacteroidota bacterium]MBL6949722.1 hypothetical protein [Bacteroidales bacterium]
MIKRYLIIPGLLFAFILFSAKSCEEDTEENRRLEEAEYKEAVDRVKDEFEADFLREESLFVFEQKAKQNLKDFADYMNIANDTSLDSAFRNQAKAMTNELFYLRHTPVISRYPTFKLFIDSIHVIQPLQRTGDSEYQGILGFREGVTRVSGQGAITSFISLKKVEILAIKSDKLFGTDTLKIWKVYLGKLVNW